MSFLPRLALRAPSHSPPSFFNYPLKLLPSDSSLIFDAASRKICVLTVNSSLGERYFVHVVRAKTETG